VAGFAVTFIVPDQCGLKIFVGRLVGFVFFESTGNRARGAAQPYAVLKSYTFSTREKRRYGRLFAGKNPCNFLYRDLFDRNTMKYLNFSVEFEIQP
jgi:hypothetical protein